MSDEKENLETDKRELEESVLSERKRVKELEKEISDNDITIDGYMKTLDNVNKENIQLQSEIDSLSQSASQQKMW